MALATWNGTAIPGIRDVEEEDVLQADEQATAGAMLRRDVVAYRRRWTLRTAPVPTADAQALRSILRAACYGSGQFAIDGGPPITCYASPPRVRRILGAEYRVVEITVTEQQGQTA